MAFFEAISVRVPSEVKRKLEAIAKKEGMSVQDVVRVAIGAYLRDDNPKKAGMPLRE